MPNFEHSMAIYVKSLVFCDLGIDANCLCRLILITTRCDNAICAVSVRRNRLFQAATRRAHSGTSRNTASLCLPRPAYSQQKTPGGAGGFVRFRLQQFSA